MQPAGAGGLYEAFIRLQRKLEAEGLFDPARKRPRPSRLRHVGVVTSLSAAALRDFLVTLRLQAPRLRVTVLASLVQGADAPPQLVAALNRTAELDIDALAVVRAGAVWRTSGPSTTSRLSERWFARGSMWSAAWPRDRCHPGGLCR